MNLKAGDKVLFKTEQELLDTGWTRYEDSSMSYFLENSKASINIVVCTREDWNDLEDSMHPFLGKEVTIATTPIDDEAGFMRILEDGGYWGWDAEVVKEKL